MEWVKLPCNSGQAPGPRSSHAAAAIGNSVYFFGGELLPRQPVENQLQCYDLETGAWRVVAAQGQAPQPRIACTMAALGNVLYVFGGRTGVEMGDGCLADLHAFNTQTGDWSQVAAAAAPPGRSYHAMAAAGGKLYVFGGCGSEGRLADLHEFDPAAASWRQLPTGPGIAPRGGSVLAAAAHGSTLFVMGGFCGKELADVHGFDVQQGAWACPCCKAGEQAASSPADSSSDGGSSSFSWAMPLARSVFGAAALGNGSNSCSSHSGHIVACGGEVDPSDLGHAGAGCFTAAVTCFSPQAAKEALQQQAAAATGAGTTSSISCWHELSPAGEGPCARGWFACTSVGAGLLLHGGLDLNNQRLGDMYLLRPCSSN